ncbi:MAG TPA: transglutaminase family protein [Casimicrobiaceae bacterium]|nr:transglutaminase family protein [Casimicrobiaceae bacterium]
MVRLEYTIDLDYELADPADFLFVIAAATTPAQRVIAERLEVDRPTATQWSVDPHNGSRLLRLRSEADALHVAYAATVEIRHHFADPQSIVANEIREIPGDVLPYLAASRYCQSDRLVAFAHAQFAALDPGYARAAAIADWVHNHVKFKVGVSNTSTSALDTLVDRGGVCRDFAHLVIALCRALNIPARFVTGIDYGADPALGPCDFHAYTEAWIGDRWYLFDATGISPLTGLVRIGTGRDAADVAFATIYGAVRTHAPSVSVRAIDDPARGIRPPMATTLAVSTAASQPPALPPSHGHGDAMLLPFQIPGNRTTDKRRQGAT